MKKEFPEFFEKVEELKLADRPVKKAAGALQMMFAKSGGGSPGNASTGTNTCSVCPVCQGQAETPSNVTTATDNGQMTLNWSLLDRKEKEKRTTAAHDAWDLFFFVHNVPFRLIDTPEFKTAIASTKRCPTFKPVGCDTLSTTHLVKQSDLADAFNESTLRANAKYGFVITGDGYRSKTKRQYHNFILLTPAGPVFLGIKDITGEGGCASDVYNEFVVVIEGLDTPIKSAIMLGILDTPSVNVKAWKLLNKKYPTQVWMGCMAHEISLFFGDVAKLPATARLKKLCHYLVKWIMNHNDLLKLFRTKVNAHFLKIKNAAKTRADRVRAASRQTMVLYKPGDTRMLTVFRMLARILFLIGPITAFFNDTEYDDLAQKCIKNYNANCKDPAKKITKRGSDKLLLDVAKANFAGKTASIYAEIEEWLQVMTSSVYFHRTVDTHKPSLFLVYYIAALVDKHLRVMKDLGKASEYIEDIHATFMKRWERFHRPCHTLAYHMAPQFRLHEISSDEKKDCLKACKQFWPDDYTKIWKQLLAFKSEAMQGKLEEKEWAEAETDLPHLWYEAYGMMLDLEDFVPAAMQLTSKASSASVAEQGVTGWSKVGCIETDKRTRILTSKTSQLVNVGGWQWSLAQRERMLSKTDRKDQLALFDALDALIARDQTEANTQELNEGIDDDEKEDKDDDAAGDADADDNADADDDTDAALPDLPEKEGETFLQELCDSVDDVLEKNNDAEDDAEEEEEEDEEGEDLTKEEDPSGPRTNLKVNPSLEAALSGVPNLRASDFNSGRKLAFEEA